MSRSGATETGSPPSAIADASVPRLSYVFLTRWNPFGSVRGGDIDYSRGLIEGLVTVGDVTALVFDHPLAPIARAPDNVRWIVHEPRTRSRLVGLLSRHPNVAHRHDDAAYLRSAIAAAEHADVVIIDFIGMFWLVEPLRRALRTLPRRPALIVVNHNVERDVRRQMAASASGAARYVLGFDAAKAARLERSANASADGIVAITEPDRRAFERMSTAASVTILPGYNGPLVTDRTLSTHVPKRAVIVGNFEAHHKRMVLEQTIDALRLKPLPPGIAIDVIGAGDMSGISPPPEVSFRGFVPDIRAHFDGVRLGILCDQIGGGFKLRLLTYAFCRLPIIAVPSAIEGSGFRPGEHFIPIESLADLSGAIASAIGDIDRLNAIQTAAFNFAADNYDWDDRGRDLDAFARSLVATKSRAMTEVKA